jgi:hypothetical protein
VRDLTLLGDVETSTPWFNDSLPRLAAMTAVESLCIHAGRFESLDEAAVVDFISSFNKLKQFQLLHCTFSTPHQLSLALLALSVWNSILLD